MRQRLFIFVTAMILCATPAVAQTMSASGASAATAAKGAPTAMTGAMGTMGAHMSAGPHMTMTALRPAKPMDEERAMGILSQMRVDLAKYRDYKKAEADGYKPFMPTVPQDIYHFANRRITKAEYSGYFDLAHPGSLLYEKRALGGYKLVGAMYDAPPAATPAELDQRIPLSVGRWHAHTNICLPHGLTAKDVMNGKLQPKPTTENMGNREERGFTMPGSGVFSEMVRRRVGYMADRRFGFDGTISTKAACEAVDGNFYPQIFGWMIHVYPFQGEDLRAAFSTTAP